MMGKVVKFAPSAVYPLKTIGNPFKIFRLIFTFVRCERNKIPLNCPGGIRRF